MTHGWLKVFVDTFAAVLQCGVPEVIEEQGESTPQEECSPARQLIPAAVGQVNGGKTAVPWFSVLFLSKNTPPCTLLAPG